MKVTTRRGRHRFHWVQDLLDSSGQNWDFSRLTALSSQGDADAISRIKLPARQAKDFVACGIWRNTGIFTVRSAHNLALKLELAPNMQSTSSAPDGARQLWKIFLRTSKYSHGSLPVMPSRHRGTNSKEIWKTSQPAALLFTNPAEQCFSRTTNQANSVFQPSFSQPNGANDTCPICASMAETSFHATVECPHARNLRSAMRDRWSLPNEELFHYSGPDWLLLLLDQCHGFSETLPCSRYGVLGQYITI